MDVDGTLYPRRFYVRLVLALVRRMFCELQGRSPEDADRLVAKLEHSMRTRWQDTSVSGFVLAHGITPEQWRDYRNEHFDVEPHLRPSPGVSESLTRLRTRLGVALLTNNARRATSRVLCAIELSEADFDVVLCAEETEGQPKPHRRGFMLAAAELGVAAKHCWGVGDRFEVDVAPMVGLGGSGIAVAGPHELPPAVDYLLSRSAGTRAGN